MAIVEYLVDSTPAGILKILKNRSTKDELARSMRDIRHILLNDKLEDKEKVKQIQAIIDLSLM